MDLFGYKSADFSACRKYRYTLWRWWDKSKPYAMFVCLNPSIADEIQDDPTVRRCINFSRDWGYGGFVMTNIFAYRATDPKEMKKYYENLGPKELTTDLASNAVHLIKLSRKAGVIVAAWGTHGAFMNRGDRVSKLIPGMKCLKITKGGFPQHPLYLAKDSELIDFNGR